MSNDIRERLQRRINGTGSRPEAIAQVRYTGWNPRDRSSNVSRFSTQSKRYKIVSGPSGQSYRFRGKETSQWLPVHDVEDLEMFEKAEDFEVNHEG